ncbi:MAG: hypothetical protein Q8N71_01165 [candidate division Zixibacteria bacterium]|nr:hypothetical protein [candidate division Zixibacteria bacterium]
MEILKLIENLKGQAERIKESRIEEIDFDGLEENLKTASEMLKKMKGKEETAENILDDFKAEIKRVALSLSRLKGDNSNLKLIEKYLSNPNLAYEELHLLKTKLKSEFDKNFSITPLSKTNYQFSKEKKVKDKIEEFKV